ncbi:Hypothetical protein POVN_LOCUS239 [uncultured virus]|nr:Hypothetical protein POVN_LOCUS239 [uncultured virus]
MSCPYGKRGRPALTQEQFLAKAKAVHGDAFDYSKAIYKTTKLPVILICRTCTKEFGTNAHNHLSGHGCPDCADNQQKSPNEFIAQARALYGNNYDYAQMDYQINRKHITITCTRCQTTFQQTPANHLHFGGCNKCDARLRKTKTRFVEQARTVYGGTRYDYTDTVYTSNHVNTNILCTACNSAFEQTPANHLAGKDGCSKCVRDRVESKGAAACRKYLKERGIEFIPEFSLECLHRRRYDFVFVYKGRLFIVEFDGEQHFKQRQIWHRDEIHFLLMQEIDKLKNLTAMAWGYNVIRLSINDEGHVYRALDYFLNQQTKGRLYVDDLVAYAHMHLPLNADLLLFYYPQYTALIKAIQPA